MKLAGLLLSLFVPVMVWAQQWSVSPKSEIIWQQQRSNQFDILKEPARFAKFEKRIGIELGMKYQAATVSWIGYETQNEWEEKSYGRFREAYLEHEWSELGLVVSLGRRIIRKGTGYIARPTSLLEGSLPQDDPEDSKGELLGGDMLLFEWFQENSTLSLALIDSDKNFNPRERPKIVFRYDTLLGETDFGVVAGISRPTIGLVLAKVFGESLELHVDILGQRGTTQAYHRITQEQSENSLYIDYPYLSPWEDSGRFFIYSVLGGQYSFGQTNVIFEWLHDSRGLSSSQFEKWSDLSQYHRQILDTQPALNQRAEVNLLWDLDTLIINKNVMRDYLFLRVGKNTGFFQPSANLLYNAQDSSFVLSPQIRYVQANLDLKAYLQLARGAANTEFGSVPQDNTLMIQLRYNLF